MKAQKAIQEKVPTLDSKTEVMCVEAIFMEGMKFVLSNYLKREHH